MSQAFFLWCRLNKQQPYIRKLTRDTVNWFGSGDAPTGSWSKGSTTLVLTRWFLSFCQTHRAQIPEQSLLFKTWEAATEIYHCLAKLYRESVWIPKARAQVISSHGLKFLSLNGECALQAFNQNRAMFTYMPNLHRLAHIFFEMQDQARVAEHVLSPLLSSCQMEEDFVGRPSRVSRRVSPKLAMLRTTERSLEAAHSAFVDRGFIQEG